MIEKYSFGTPVETGAVVEHIDTAIQGAVMQFGRVTENWPLKWEYILEERDRIFGLGEHQRGIDKRGFKYDSWCSDASCQNELTSALYGAHNFMIVFNPLTQTCFGIFFDTASKVEWDLGFTEQSVLTVTTGDTGADVYVITPDENSSLSILNNVVHQFRVLIGQSYIPPRWAFGFQQSRWGYKTEEDVRTVVKNYRENDLPLDAVCLDIDYMDSYKDFTVDQNKFPNLGALSQDLKKDGIRLIPIIDAGVKVQDGYDVYETGRDSGYFCKKENGEDFVVGVWPGRSCFPDFENPDASRWFGMLYKRLTDQGIEGFWNDMNEPAMFYSDESLKEAFDKFRSLEGQNLDVQSFFEFTGIHTNNLLEDYQRFYQNVAKKDGTSERVRHDKIHNIYGSHMTRAAGQSLREISPDKRMLLYSRASCIGSHRYGGIWTGDNASTWGQLEEEIHMIPSLNMVGYLYTGADIGGFGSSCSRDLLLRWLALGDFIPLMRNHCAWDGRNQECYAFGDTSAFKSVLDLRYALVPYIYSEYVKAALSGTMYIRPIGFDFPADRHALSTEDELFVGEGILIAPVYKQNSEGRYVYLPEDMTKVVWKDGKVTTEEKKAGSYYIYVGLDEVVFFVRHGCLVPLAKPAKDTASIDTSSFTFVGDGERYELYDDDGFTRDIRLEGRLHVLSR